MDDSSSVDISWFEQVKIQAEVLLPVLYALRAELGTERANEVVYGALREWMKGSFATMAEQIEGNPAEKWHAISAAIEPAYIDDLHIEKIRDDAEALEFDVTECRFADHFRRLNEPELGAILNCECDFHVAEIGKPEVVFSRKRTLMSGGSCCDFRYSFATRRNQDDAS